MMKCLLVVIMASLPALADSGANLTKQSCKGVGNQVLISVPTSVGATQFSIPLCVTLGNGFRLDTSVSPPKLEVVVPEPVPVPRPMVQTVVLPADAPTAFTITLAKTPVSMLMVSFRSSRAGMDMVDIVVPDPNSKQVVITLPDYRPFTADDRMTVAYWTLEQ